MGYVETYKEVKNRRTRSFRRILRNNALTVLSVLKKMKGFKEDFKKPRIQFLYFHHLFKDEEKQLESLLQKLSENHTFISYSDAVSKILNGNIDQPCIVFSSDDGFKNNIDAAKIFNAYGIQACFFINPYIIGNNDFEEVKKYCSEKLHFPPVKFLNWNDVETLQKMGHEIGSHTMNHINIAETPLHHVREDLEKTHEILTQRCGVANHFAFPYGRFEHFSEEARQVVFNTGFISCASAERGSHINSVKKLSKAELCIHRDQVVFDWNINHLLYFIAQSSRSANVENNIFPYLSQRKV